MLGTHTAVHQCELAHVSVNYQSLRNVYDMLGIHTAVPQCEIAHVSANYQTV
jgi:hypothetical protein